MDAVYGSKASAFARNDDHPSNVSSKALANITANLGATLKDMGADPTLTNKVFSELRGAFGASAESGSLKDITRENVMSKLSEETRDELEVLALKKDPGGTVDVLISIRDILSRMANSGQSLASSSGLSVATGGF
jgi:hypothetical protein